MLGKISSNVRTMGRWLVSCERTLGEYQEKLNAINVFPVADADTGTNLYRTACAATAGVRGHRYGDIGSLITTAAQAAMDGAQGNSGTLLAVFWRAFAEPLLGARRLNAPLYAEALNSAKIRAWSALSEPVAGTMLSVVEAAATAASQKAQDESNRTLAVALEASLQAAGEAVHATAGQLDRLRQLSVVDAGALGLFIVLDCLCGAVIGRSRSDDRLISFAGNGIQPEQVFHDGGSGMEVMCTIALSPLDAAHLRITLDQLGDSVIVSLVEQTPGADRARWRVHVHTQDPERVFRELRALGEPSRVSMTQLGVTQHATPEKGDHAGSN